MPFWLFMHQIHSPSVEIRFPSPIVHGSCAAKSVVCLSRSDNKPSIVFHHLCTATVTHFARAMPCTRCSSAYYYRINPLSLAPNHSLQYTRTQLGWVHRLSLVFFLGFSDLRSTLASLFCRLLVVSRPQKNKSWFVPSHWSHGCTANWYYAVLVPLLILSCPHFLMSVNSQESGYIG